jgi:hypothetical protein
MNHTPSIHQTTGHTIQREGDSAELLQFSRTLERVSARTIELAGLDGRPAHEISQWDYERAKREIAANPSE